jgi:hypothetical protein
MCVCVYNVIETILICTKLEKIDTESGMYKKFMNIVFLCVKQYRLEDFCLASVLLMESSLYPISHLRWDHIHVD